MTSDNSYSPLIHIPVVPDKSEAKDQREEGMPQLIVRAVGNDVASLQIPSPLTPLLPGLRWGRQDVVFTPAYWKALLWSSRDNWPVQTYRLGKTLAEEVAACLLGGYGIPSEVGIAAFHRLRTSGLLAGPISKADVAEALHLPLSVNGRLVRYRFAEQRSRYVASALVRLHENRPSEVCHTDFRDWLLTLDGVGLKTASWITRNWLGSDEVAIIDIHIYRAGLIGGFFQPSQNITKDYRQLEAGFLAFCRAIGEKPAAVDALIWSQMKNAGNFARRVFRQTLTTHEPLVKLRKVA